ncbi:hypothetical protein [uncultured Bacteroides sp.]|uniref:hypothetical protein n=1 Tax=uncultured Bacteroides sp. TaxID=162156 RepID=UPI002AAB7C76|nr:hypothetical protein [uncultured Bacteroides sp.]
MKNILLIGGTGVLGSGISRILKKRNNEINILLGSRNPSTENQIEVDVNRPNTFQNMINHKVDLVVMCTTDPLDTVLSFCINQEIDYLDVTKPSPQLTKTYQNFTNTPINSRIVLASAWMGGAIPSLIKDACHSDEIIDVKIFIYYSLEDRSGKSAADFMAENVSTSFSIYTNSTTQKVRHFEGAEKHNFSFIKNTSLKTTYFDIPDLFILHKVENIKNIVAKVAYSSNATNNILALLQKLNIFRLLSLSTRKKLFQSQGKGDITGFEIYIKKKDNIQQKVSLVHQDGQSELTAYSTCLNIEQLLNKQIDNGFYFSHQLYRKGEYTTKLKTNNKISIK